MSTANAFDCVQLHASERATSEHERQVHQKLGGVLCELLDITPPRVLPADVLPDGRPYYLPARTLTGSMAEQLGIQSETDFFGGWVSAPFIATKAISHPLFPGGLAPAAWAQGFADTAGAALLPGWTVFSKADARRAAGQFLGARPVRLKPVRATGGRGQEVIHSPAALEAALELMADGELAEWGLVLEENLHQVETYSVGQVRVGSLVASYVGTQRLTQDHSGAWVYGGSDLNVHRGGYDALLGLPLPPVLKQAVRGARAYEEAVLLHYPGFMASRRNYDIATGLAHDGARLTGVLEQSWRVGGASSAELLALRAFHRNPRLHQVHASTYEVFGDTPCPTDAELFFQGDDPEVGPLLKYARIQTHGDSQ
jgi:Protein of unknown function (DUF3182)